MKRREFLATGLATATAALLPVTFARAGTWTKGKLVVVILRGALDGLAAVPPYGDPDYPALRGELALPGPGAAGGVLPLSGLFGLHPSLAFLHEAFAASELIVFHAVASPYRERSHFDGQNVLETGLTQPHAAQTGWLNRALAALPSHRDEPGVALGPNVPLLMRGPAEVASWSPSKLAVLDVDTVDRITDLYASDPLLAARLAEALEADAMASTSGAEAMSAGQARTALTDERLAGRYREIIRAAAGFLRRANGPQVAVFDTTGWDTHANEGAARGTLATRLSGLDAGLRILKAELNSTWSDTAVLLVTEFGRTAAINGTRGTDHGTATVAWLLGGAVNGGRVIADWPGLSRGSLREGRDLAPTRDLRAVLKGVLRDHLRVPERALSRSVFPDSEGVRALDGLMRA